MTEPKWELTLSTTEKNNIGLIKPRKNNENSEVMKVKLIKNSKPYDLTALKVFFVTHFSGRNNLKVPVQKEATVINAEEGIFEFTLDEDCMQKVGRQEAYFEIYDYDKFLDATQSFTYEIISSSRQMKADFTPYITTWEEAEKMLDEGTAKVLNDKTEKLELQKANVVDVNEQLGEQKQETDNKLEKKTNNTTFVAITADMQRQIERVQSGMLGEFDSEAQLKTTYPNGAKGYAVVWLNENSKKVGYTYTYKNRSWVKGNVWNGVGIADKSVSPAKTTFLIPASNLIDFEAVTEGYTINSLGEPLKDEYSCLSDFIKVEKETDYSHFNITQVARYDQNKNYLSVFGSSPVNSREATYFRVVMKRRDFEKSQLNKGSTLTEFDNGKDRLSKEIKLSKDNIEDFEVNNEDIAEDTLSNSKIKTLGSNYTIFYLANLIEIDTELKNVIIPAGTSFLVGKSFVRVNSDVSFKLTSEFSYFYINLKNGDLKHEISRYSLTDMNEDFLLFLIVSFDGAGSNELRHVTFNGDYRINGQIASRISGQNFKKSERKYFTEKIPVSNYAPVETIADYSAETHYKDNVQMSDILSNFDKAVQDYPNWASKTLLGNDSSGTYPIYKYEFKAEQVPSSKFSKPYPKIILIAGTHGEEKLSALSVSQYIYDLAYNWEQDETLEYVRYNTHLIIIPFLNPWGFQNRSRKNSNGVDINRNSSERWETSTSNDPNAADFKGTAPFSEKENQYFRDLILENKDAAAFFDYHMNGTSGEEGDYLHNFWHSIADFPKEEGFNEINEISKRNIMLMTKISQSKYKTPKDSGWCGMISYNVTQSTLTAYAYAQGIPSITLECLKKLQHEDVVYSKEALSISTEFLGNSIINTCRSFVNN